ncbi:uncharacterized protein K02A2.6-like [Formica exsecta]|uniref:uncharacterized protein K02A2.6-like n=1 Tax=Formica exsecta TaxID=72781 RepID=UPI001144B373|nr:uncharacterized protein K02A2.6-like [Formica exsecta]
MGIDFLCKFGIRLDFATTEWYFAEEPAVSQAYFQIPVAKESREITAFSVPGKGLYYFTRMPYGLTEAPATFQRLLDKIIGPEMEPHAFAYLDDIVIVTPTFEEHLEWLESVLTKTFAADLTINPEKYTDKVQPILDYPDPLNIKQTDASSVGIGAVLTQNIEGTEHVVVFASRALADPEKNSLRWLHNLKNPTGRLARWALELLEYDYEIVHRKGALHHVPDALSRMYESDTEVKIMVAVEADIIANTTDAWPKAIVSDIVEDLDRWKLVLPKELRETALREAHDTPQSGHLGVEKTFHRLAVAYYWSNMFRDTAKYVKQCDACQRTKVEQANSVGLMGHRVVEGPWTMVAADIMGPFPKSKAGFAYVLVVQDLFTKWMECFALRAANGKKICEALREVISRWGTPKFLLTDNGTEFANQTLQAFSEEHGITHTTIPPYHPQANPVERVNRVLKTMIVAFLERDHRKWDEHLRDFRFAYNIAHHSSIGTSPALLNLGREPTPINSIRERCANVDEVEQRNPAEWSERMRKMQSLHNWAKENLERAY